MGSIRMGAISPAPAAPSLPAPGAALRAGAADATTAVFRFLEIWFEAAQTAAAPAARGSAEAADAAALCGVAAEALAATPAAAFLVALPQLASRLGAWGDAAAPAPPGARATNGSAGALRASLAALAGGAAARAAPGGAGFRHALSHLLLRLLAIAPHRTALQLVQVRAAARAGRARIGGGKGRRSESASEVARENG